MIPNQKYASESPEDLHRITFLWSEAGVRDGFRAFVLIELTRNRLQTHDQLCVLPK